jgi:hypothetical protein
MLLSVVLLVVLLMPFLRVLAVVLFMMLPEMRRSAALLGTGRRGGRLGDGLGKQTGGRKSKDHGEENEELLHDRNKTGPKAPSYAALRKRCNRANTRFFPRTRKMAVMLGPALVPVTARRATA